MPKEIFKENHVPHRGGPPVIHGVATRKFLIFMLNTQTIHFCMNGPVYPEEEIIGAAIEINRLLSLQLNFV